MKADRPGVILPPPLIYALFLTAGLSLRHWPPWRGLDDPARILIACWLVVAALLIATAAAVTMLRARTAIDPYTASTSLVTRGPFAFTRNPLYLSMLLFYVSLAIYFRGLMALIFIPLLIAALEWGVIRREERYLETKFGDDYRAYRARVRRWL